MVKANDVMYDHTISFLRGNSSLYMNEQTKNIRRKKIADSIHAMGKWIFEPLHPSEVNLFKDAAEVNLFKDA